MPTEVTLILPKPHAAQMKIKSEAARFNTIACGRRFGKTTLGLDLVIHPLLHSAPVGWFAPNYKILIDAWNSLEAYLRPVKSRSNFTEKRIETVTGGVLEFWTLEDKDAGRSRKYKRVVVDEAGLVPNLGAIWQQSIRPTLTDLHGDAWLMGTPKGRNFFWECYQRGQDALRPDWMSWQMPTTANPHIDPAEVRAAELDMPERSFAQEYLAEFLEDGGGVFRGVRAQASATLQSEGIEGHRYCGGGDWARSNDYSVFTVIDCTTSEVVAIERHNKVEYVHQMNVLQGLCKRFDLDVFYSEENSMGAPINEQLKRTLKKSNGEPVLVQSFQTTNASKQMAIDDLQLAFEQKTIRIPDDSTVEGKAMISELEAYEGNRTPSGVMKYGAPEGLNDDCVMSLAIAWQGVKMPAPPTFARPRTTGRRT
jgi:hypothetical protein